MAWKWLLCYSTVFVKHFIGDTKIVFTSLMYFLGYVFQMVLNWTSLSIMPKTGILFFVVANLKCRCIFVRVGFFQECSREKWKASVALHCKHTVLLNVHYKKTYCEVIWKEGLLVGKQNSSWHIYTAAPSIAKMPNKRDKYRYNT